MKKDNILIEMSRYFSGDMDDLEKKELEEKVKLNPQYKKEYESFLVLEKAFINSTDRIPDARLFSRFLSDLEAFREKKTAELSPKKLRYFPVLQWAAGIALFILGFGFSHLGRPLNSEITKEIGLLREEIQETKSSLLFAQLRTPTTSDRIRAVQMSYDLGEIGDEVLEGVVELRGARCQR